MSTEAPTVVRLSSPGAAVHWARGRQVLQSIDPGSEPPAKTGLIWLHDDPGSVAVADAFIAECRMRALAWTILLTGPSVEAGPPTLGTTEHGPDRSIEGKSWTRVQVPVGDPRTELERALAKCDFLMAQVWRDRLSLEAPGAVRRYAWIQLTRLRLNGRYNEVEHAATVLADRSHCRAEVLREVSIACLWSQRYARASQYARAVHAATDNADLIADAAHLEVDARVRRGSREQPPPACAPWIVCNALRNTGTDEARSALEALPGRYPALVAQEMDSSVEEPAAWLRLGHLFEGFRIHHNIAGTPVALMRHWFPDATHHLAFEEVEEALDQGDLEAARSRLQALHSFSSDGGTYGTIWMLFWGRACAGLGLASEVAWAGRAWARRHGLSAFDAAGLFVTATPAAEEIRAHPTTTSHWLQILWRTVPSHRPVLRAQLALLPATPLSVGGYEMTEPLASGGMGMVWTGVDLISKTPVAAKVLHNADADAIEAFAAEIDVVSSLDHPAIIAVHGLVRADEAASVASQGKLGPGQSVLMMELVDGGSLQNHQGMLAWDSQKAVLLALLDALSYAHAKGILHRDLKPANVLITPDGAIRLTDFGISSMSTDRLAGTPSYMAPEQFRKGPLDARADLYALGCLAWALATGLPPWVSSDIRRIAEAHRSAPLPRFEPSHAVPDDFIDWLRTCLAKSRSERFPSAGDAAHALMSMSESMREGVEPRPAEPAEATFLLSTLLDIHPSEDAESTQGGPSALQSATLGRVVFGMQQPWREGSSSPSLLRRGDPPLLRQDSASAALWRVLLSVATRRRPQRIALVGPPGHGLNTLIRKLIVQARMAGLHLLTTPTPEVLCLVEEDTKTEPWLVLCSKPGPGVETIQVADIGVFGTWMVLMSRLLLLPSLAAQAAMRSAGTPAVALDIVSDWLEEPGLRRVGSTLAPLRWRLESNAEREHWTRIRDDPSVRADSLRLPGFAGEAGHHRLTLNGACKLPEVLRVLALTRTTDAERQAAYTDASPTEQRYLNLLGGQGEEALTYFLNHPHTWGDPVFVDALRQWMDVGLVAHPVARMLLDLAQCPRRVLNKRGVDPLTLRMRFERKLMDPSWFVAAEAALGDAPDLRVPLAQYAVASGRLEWLDRGDGPDLAVLRAATSGSDLPAGDAHTFTWTAVAEWSLRHGDPERALAATARTQGVWNLSAVTLRAIALTALGDLPAALREAEQGLPHAWANRDTHEETRLQWVWLHARAHQPGHDWDFASARAGPCPPLLARYL